MAKPLVVGNWKSYVNSLKEAKQLLHALEKSMPREARAGAVLCPPFPLLDTLARNYRGTCFSFGAQDAFYESGAHTGEVSMALVKDAKAKYVILGHAERRARGDTDMIVAKKTGAALDARLTPIVCVGELARDKEGHYLAELEQSVLASLEYVGPQSFKKIVIAYEPVWAIGAPLPPSARVIRETVIFIRKALAQRFDRADVLKARILYGGAVNGDSVAGLISESCADGFLLGRASVDAEAFAGIIRAYT